MFDPFVIQQAYIIDYTLAFVPSMAIAPQELNSIWQPVSAFADRRPTWRPRNLIIPNVGALSAPPSSPYSPWSNYKFSIWPRPWVLKTDDWSFEWLPGMGLPPGSNPSTCLYLHLFPVGVVSISLATSIGFGDGIELDLAIALLRQMAPQDESGSRKSPWLRVVAPDAFSGMEVNLDSLAEVILHEMQRTLFASPVAGQVIRMERDAGEPHLSGHHGGVIDLVRTEPQLLQREKHAAALRGIVTMRPNWMQVEADRLQKYRNAPLWTGRPETWHYAGGFNTVVWNSMLPAGRDRRGSRTYAWRAAAISELARIEKVLYEYSRDFVVRRAHDRLLAADTDRLKQLQPANWPRQFRLGEWKRFWLALADLPRVLGTDDQQRAYASHAQALQTEKARQDFGDALGEYAEALKTYSWLGKEVQDAVVDVGDVIKAVGTISTFVASLGRLFV